MLDVLRAAAQLDGALARTWSMRRVELLRILTAVCGAAPFLASFLTRHPSWLIDLANDDLHVARTADADAARLALAFEQVAPTVQSQTPRLFKYYELTRITVRELSADLVADERSGETLAELSHLADALLTRALACAAERLTSTSGPPVWRAPDGRRVELGFCVIALGKLGSEELNY